MGDHRPRGQAAGGGAAPATLTAMPSAVDYAAGHAWVVHAVPGVDLLLVRVGRGACSHAIWSGARAASVRTVARG
jgi:hypothetical protein